MIYVVFSYSYAFEQCEWHLATKELANANQRMERLKRMGVTTVWVEARTNISDLDTRRFSQARAA